MSSALERLRFASGPPIVLRLGADGPSARVNRRIVVCSAGLLLFGFVAFIAEIAWGDFPLSPIDATLAVFGAGSAGSGFIVYDLRLPRALVAAGAGVALGLAGCLFQTMARNPLASPDIIGIVGGAALAGVATFVLAGEPSLVAPAAFAGALGTAGLLYVLAWRDGLSPYRFILIGVGVSAMAVAGTSYVLIEGRIEDVSAATVWLVGSVNNRIWSDVWPLAIGLAVLIPILAVLARSLDALALGDDSARSLGVAVERSRLGLVAVGAGLVAIAVSAAGPIGFVALIAPNIARRISNSGGAAVLPVAGLCGGALVLAADFAARFVLAPTELPVGIVTAILGAPFFLMLLRRAGRVRTEAG